MNAGTVAKALKIFGGLLVLLWLFESFTTRMQPLLTLIFYVGIVVAGFVIGKRAPKQQEAPVVPAGFNPTYQHTNIALDTGAGTVWLRDRSRSRIFSKGEIIGIQALYDNMQGMPTMISGGVVHQGTQIKKNIRIDVQTMDLDHPTYTVRFPIKSIFQNTDNLYAEAAGWANRLHAFLRT